MNRLKSDEILSHRKALALCVFGFALVASSLVSSAAVITFDDRPGFSGGHAIQDQSVPTAYLIHDEYLPMGVRFDSSGGGIAILSSINAVSPTNVAMATEPGPVISFNVPVTATFLLNGSPAVVDTVALTLTSTINGTCRLKAFDRNGILLGSTSGGNGSTLQLAYSNQIHSVEIDQGSLVFDDFTFTGLTAIVLPPITLSIDQSGTNVVLSWTQGLLQQADAPDGTYTDVAGAASPYYVTPADAMKFYRLRIPQ